MRICYIDIIDKCNLRCPTCVRGAQLLKNSASAMPLDLFEKLVAKAKGEGYDTIGLYNWIEPFLCKDVDSFIEIIKAADLDCELSSNLSLKPASYFDTIQRALRKGVDRLTVSVSGFHQETYEINHVGGNIAWIKENLEQIALLKKKSLIQTKVFLRLIQFDYNAADEPLLREYARSLKLEFEVIPGVGNPKQSVAQYAAPNFYEERLKNFNSADDREAQGEVCPLIMDTVAINSQGDVYICCAYPYYSSLRIGSYLELSKQELLLKRYMHPICPSCDFTRRKTTPADRDRLVDALEFKLGFVKNLDNSLETVSATTELPQQPPLWTRTLKTAYRGMVDKFKAHTS